METHLVSVRNNNITTTVTTRGHAVSNWITTIRNVHLPSINPLIVSLDVKWCPRGAFGTRGMNPIATLQLCIGHLCLVFHLIHCDYIPEELCQFLTDYRFRFVGVRIRGAIVRLYNDYGFVFGDNVQDLAETAALRTGRQVMEYMRLDELVWELLGVSTEITRPVRLSNWANHWLNRRQIECATADAFWTFTVGQLLNS